jgi:hypothetical protein
MTGPSEIKRHVEQALGDDPRMAVVAVKLLTNHDLPWLEERAIRFARASGYSWAKLGRLLGRSRQAVHRRHLAIDGTPQPLPRRPMRDGDRIILALWYQTLADGRRRREYAELDADEAVPW